MQRAVPQLSKGVVYTDEALQYSGIDKDFADHDFTTHSAGEYVKREKPQVHTNTVEGFYSIFKLGIKDMYQHYGKQHLHRYTAEFGFHHNYSEASVVNNAVRASKALSGAEGKRLLYRDSLGA